MGIILCDGYVTESQFQKHKVLIMNRVLCDGYVITSTNVLRYSLKFLFDRETDNSTKNIISGSLSIDCLFDGYLTGLTSFPHWKGRAYLTKKPSLPTKKDINPLFSIICLFDGYLTETLFLTQLANPKA